MDRARPQALKLITDGPQRSVLAILLGLLWAGAYSFPGLGSLLPRIAPLGFDFFHYYCGVIALQMGIVDIYGGQRFAALAFELSQGRWKLANAYFPGFFVFMLPFGQLPFDDAYLWFLLLSVIFYLLSLILVCRLLFAEIPLGTLTGALLGAFSLYTGDGMDCLALGQMGFVVSGLIFLTFVFSEKGFRLTAGVCLGLAALTKTWPAFLALYFLYRREGRVLAGFFLAIIVPTLVAGYLWGFAMYPYLFKALAGYGYLANPANQSLTGWLVNFWGLSQQATRPFHLLTALWLVVGLGVLRRKMPKFPRALEFSLYIVSACLLAPWSWPHHHLVLTMPLAAFLERSLRSQRLLRWAGTVTLASLFLMDGEIVSRSPILMLHALASAGGMIFLLMALTLPCLFFEGAQAVSGGSVAKRGSPTEPPRVEPAH